MFVKPFLVARFRGRDWTSLLPTFHRQLWKIFPTISSPCRLLFHKFFRSSRQVVARLSVAVGVHSLCWRTFFRATSRVQGLDDSSCWRRGRRSCDAGAVKRPESHAVAPAFAPPRSLAVCDGFASGHQIQRRERLRRSYSRAWSTIRQKLPWLHCKTGPCQLKDRQRSTPSLRDNISTWCARAPRGTCTSRPYWHPYSHVAPATQRLPHTIHARHPYSPRCWQRLGPRHSWSPLDRVIQGQPRTRGSRNQAHGGLQPGTKIIRLILCHPTARSMISLDKAGAVAHMTDTTLVNAEALYARVRGSTPARESKLTHRPAVCAC